ncbi:MAG: endonuclease/exonuclease/phosphatase family protein [Candidatus Eisenbacteria bacterium]
MAGASLRLMTWNVLYASATSPLGGWETRGPVVRETIVDADADIVCLQEIAPEQIEFARTGVPGYEARIGEASGVSRHPREILFIAPVALAAWAGLYRAFGAPPWAPWLWCMHALLFAFGVLAPLGLFALVRYRGPFRRPGEFCPILYQPSRVRPTAEGSAWLSNTPLRPGSLFPLQFEPRVVHWARFTKLADDSEFLVVNAHFGHAPWHYAGTARVVLELIARERPTTDAPVFLLGDFNAVAEAGIVRRLVAPRGSLRLAWEDAALREGPEMTFQWNLAPGFAPLRLDHVLYAGAMRVERARVLTPRVGGKPPSDHDPVVVEFLPVGAEPR